MTKRKIIFLILTLVWMGVIFSFSARKGDTSTADSNQIGMLVGKYLVPEFETWSEEEQIVFARGMDHPIRKTAHAMEYAILGVFLLGIFTDKKHKIRYNSVSAWCIGTVYAASDEFHQLFVEGRSGQISDVFLDSTGVLAGVLIASACIGLQRWCKKRNHRKDC